MRPLASSRGSRVASLLLVVVAASAWAQSGVQLAHPDVNLGGRLYRAVFAPGPGALTSGDLADVPEPYRSRLSEFLQRRAAFRSRFKGTAEDIDAVLRDAKRRALERAIVSLARSDDIAPRALAFVQEAPIADEWDGMPAEPLAEAAYAEKLLAMDPGTPLAPFLHLFIAHRQRAAAEAAAFRDDTSAAASASAAAEKHLAQARAASDPIYGLVADDMARVERVYVTR